MKIAISYPPIVNEIGQKAMFRKIEMFNILANQLIYFSGAGTSGYNVKKRGYEVIWDDGNSELKSFEEWFDDLIYLKHLIFLREPLQVKF